MLSSTAKSAFAILEARGLAASVKVTAPDRKGTALHFVYSTEFTKGEVDPIVDEKKRLLAQHYDLSETIGKHGEKLVAMVCKELAYTEIEIRKEKHGTEELGIGKGDIDVFAKPPNRDYYQNIEVKNRRDPVKVHEVSHVETITRFAASRWKLSICSALVTTFAQETAKETAMAIHLPIAFTFNVWVPERHRTLYEELNDRLALNVKITDTPTDILRKNFRTYIAEYNYPGNIPAP